MTEPSDTTSDDGTLTPNRRTLLGALGGAVGVATFTNPISRAETAVGAADAAVDETDPQPNIGTEGGGQYGGEPLCTRACSETSGGWSTGAVTLAACPQGSGGEAVIEVTGRIGPDRTQEPTGQNGGGGGGAKTVTSQEQTVAAEQSQTTGDGTSQEQTIIVEQHQTVIHRCDDDSTTNTAANGTGAGTEHVILFDGTHQGENWSWTDYYLEVTGEIEPSQYNGASIDPELDLWENASGVAHKVGDHKDAYAFTGEIRELDVNGPANVYLDGERIDPNSVGGAAGSNGEGPSQATVSLEPGEKRTLWYTGTIAHFHMSNDDINLAIANDGA